jgi:two-component system nitrogen regulation response regulator NtrX
MTGRILVIDDEVAIRDTMRMILEYEGLDCITAGSGAEGLAAAEREAPDLVFLDIKMPGMDGLETLSRLRGMNDTLPVVIVSAHGTASSALEAGRLGAFRFIEKPLSKDYVLDAIREGIELGSLKRENRQMRSVIESKHHLVGSSPALGRIMDQVKRAAPTNATVLILGESGVGKELIARAIHRASLRARERFVQVNCAAIPEELIESELFGHERGAFTGATEKQVGKFEMADRGTIFLDEIGDMSAKTQAKVLRVLQEGEVERLGSSRTIKVDVRVIAATNKDLEDEIAQGRFREDLYFRLSVIPVTVPALRERLDDIAPLVQHFAALFAKENNRKPARFSPSALEAFRQARWRGNIRELRNVVDRLLIMSDREVFEADDVRQVVRTDTASTAPRVAMPSGPQPGTLREFKEWSERAFLVERLREHEWNISKTAEVIDTPRSNLYKKLEQYAIAQESDG